MFSVSRFVATTPVAAWDLLSSTRTWTTWGPSITAVDPADAHLSLGMRGRVRTPIGVWLPFCITCYDPPHSWAWSVFNVPATRHTVETVPGGCRISFSVPAAALPYLIVCRVALDRIAALLETDHRP